jgi:molybdenum cofactor guanylyltransferase
VRAAGVVLAGGRSERMGTDKASLEWRSEPLLAHVVRALGVALRDPGTSVSQGPIVVVGAPGRALPPVSGDVDVVEDSVAGRGPLQGLRDGLAALGARADVAFVAATDLPLLRPDFVLAVLEAVGDDTDVAVPVAGGRVQPLAAAYRTSLLPVLDELLAAGELRVRTVLERCRVRELGERELREHDPDLASLVNVNTAADLARLRGGTASFPHRGKAGTG